MASKKQQYAKLAYCIWPRNLAKVHRCHHRGHVTLTGIGAIHTSKMLQLWLLRGYLGYQYL